MTRRIGLIPLFRRCAKRLFFRHRVVRELVLLLGWPRLRRQAPDLAHIPLLKEVVVGPVQRDEALLLFGLVRVLRPAVLLEVGFCRGLSAFNFLRAMDPDARLYSFDIEPSCAEFARDLLGNDPRLRFRLRSQDAIEQADLDGAQADFIFLDASHDLELNKATFERLLDLIAARALLVVHDTGTLPHDMIPPTHQDLARALRTLRENWIGDAEYEHVPSERAFVNWILDTYPEFAQVHLHSSRTPRWGLTLLQRSSPLPRSEEATTTPAEKLAALNGGDVASFQRHLDSLRGKCLDSEEKIAFFVFGAQKTMEKAGVNESLASVIEHVDSSIPENAPKQECSGVFAAYATLRARSQPGSLGSLTRGFFPSGRGRGKARASGRSGRGPLRTPAGRRGHPRRHRG